MEYRYLGRSGLKVSALSFGAWVTFNDQLDVDHAYACMKEAYDRGCNFFDNAEVYAAGKAETIMGEVLRKAGWSRNDLVISTKIFWGGEPAPPAAPPTGSTTAASRASTSSRAPTPRSSGWAWTTWTWSSATAPTWTRPSRRRCGP